MVNSIRYWLRAFGLIDKDNKISPLADFIFDMEANAQGPRRYQNLALAGFLAVGPYLVIPVIGILFFKKKWLSVQAKKVLQSLGNENYR